MKSNNQLATGASKAGGGWQESVDNHTAMTVGDDKQQEHGTMMRAMTKMTRAARAMVTMMRVPGNKEGEGGKGSGVDNKGGVR